MEDFLTALKRAARTGQIPVIPDIKCFSPKEGDLLRGRDPLEIARELAAAGAPALSVVTQEKDFHGSMELLRQVCGSISLPVLRKDFITGRADLEETRMAGASAILLMYSCLGREKLEELYYEARQLSLVPFVETHTEEELVWAGELGAPLVGINNRDILQLERDDGDVSLAAGLLSGAPESFLVVESALRDGWDVRRAVKSGADAALCGTAVLKADDLTAKYRSLTRRCGIKICGVMNAKDAALTASFCPDLTGIVVEYPVAVPWNLGLNEAKPLMEQLRGKTTTCVVTGGKPEKVISLARELCPDYVQLHFRETLEETAAICRILHSMGIKVIRSIPEDPSIRAEISGTEDLVRAVLALQKTEADAFLFDTRDAGNAAGGGGSILRNEEQIRKAAAVTDGRQIIIGGGIKPENAWQAISRLSPDLLDVMSATEDEPGRKSSVKIQKLLGAMEESRCQKEDLGNTEDSTSPRH